jgi:hypothetical protein
MEMVERTVLLREIDALPPVCRAEVLDFVRNIRKRKAASDILLEQAAALAADDYRADPELTAFCALDGEDFCATR